MGDAPEALLFDLVEWIANEPRPYAEALNVWRTSCPRLTVWEDAFDLGYICREGRDSRERRVCVTEAGRVFLKNHGRALDRTMAGAGETAAV